MRALVLKEVGTLVYDTQAARPVLQKDEVLLRVCASGICGSDLARVFEKGTYSMPMIPGHEFAGRIEEVGPGVDSGLVGRRAAVFPMLPCMRCASCARGEYETCKAYSYYGSRRDGGFAEYCAVKTWNLVFLDDGISYEEGAMMEPAAVAVHALRRANIGIGDTVGIAGAGPIGLMLASWAGLAGASRILLWDIDERKISFAREMGFEAISSLKEDPADYIGRITGGRGMDICVEGAGVPQTLGQCILAAAIGGRVVTMGNPAGKMTLEQHTYWEILRKQISLTGTWNSSYAQHGSDWRLALEAMGSGRLNVRRFITHRCGLSDGIAPFEMMRERAVFYNKVMFIIQEDRS
ncbi:MAG TPA: galactitol-1-phosphate 5-dehydrogenase [Feifaniaceae bacterium]|nr:galactitol-1-phosphate 5-dehydrogenase [Feifaniaceae bacterium]